MIHLIMGNIQRTVREKSGLRWRAGDLEVWGGFAEYLLGLMGTLLACWCFTLLPLSQCCVELLWEFGYRRVLYESAR